MGFQQLCMTLLAFSLFFFNAYRKYEAELCIWEHKNHLLSNKWSYQKGLFSNIICGKKIKINHISSQSSHIFENLTLSCQESFYSQQSIKCKCIATTECFKQNRQCCWLLNVGTPCTPPLSHNYSTAFDNEHVMCKQIMAKGQEKQD